MRFISLTIFALVLAMPLPALAHVAAASEGDFAWSWEPWVLISLAVAAMWYWLGVRRLRQERGNTTLIDKGRQLCFAAGLFVVFIALVSPIDTIGEQLFSVHMVQHLLLLLAAAPLIVIGRPALAFLWAFAPAQRKWLGGVWVSGRLARVIEFLMRPVLVWVIFAGVFIFWHIPRPYTWALRHELIHDFEHLSFFISALMFWTIVIEPSGRRRIDYGTTILFVATMAIMSGLPGALMILTTRPFYLAHAHTVGHWGLTLLQDQQLAGLVMWIPAGFVYVAAIAWLFIRWLDESERRTAVVRNITSSALPVVLLAVVLGGCQQNTANANVARVGGDPARGSAVIERVGCGVCHTIPGISGADGLVGPPLNRIGSRDYIAGVLRNKPSNMVRWLKDPQSIVPGNVMPNTGLSDKDARDVAAYLYTLR
jgi:cytochrome c oxidase assembly factor CtaG/cytochrome c2